MSRLIRSPRGAAISCKGWQQEAALRMLMNNLDPEVAEDPEHLIVYGGTSTELASSTRGAQLCVRMTPTGLPDWISSVSSASRSRSASTIASKQSQLRAALPVPP